MYTKVNTLDVVSTDQEDTSLTKIEFPTILKLIKFQDSSTFDMDGLSFRCEKAIGEQKAISFDKEMVTDFLTMLHNYCNLRQVSRVAFVGKSALRLIKFFSTV